MEGYNRIAVCVLCLFFARAGLNAQVRYAPATASCRSIKLLPVRGSLPEFGPVTLYFTTFDGTTGFPNVTYWGEASHELRPRAGEPGVYESDFVMVDDSGYLAEYGSLTLRLPTTDSDANGLADVMQKAFAGNARFTGDGRIDAPDAASFSLSGQISRATNALIGNMGVTLSLPGGAATFSGSVRLSRAQGTMEYTRSPPITARFFFQRTDGNGSVQNLKAATPFTVLDQNRIALPDFVLTSDAGEAYPASGFVLTRVGRRYSGTLHLGDGATETPWADYTNWLVEIVDYNDGNRNGIPDLTDPALGPEAVKPTLTVAYPRANARFSNAVITVKGTAGDNRGLGQVLCALNGGPFQPANGKTSWSRIVTLTPGTNVIAIKAVDEWGNESPTRYLVAFHPVPSALRVTTSGNGSISPNLNGQRLLLGTGYSITAVPGPGFVFSNWSGGSAAATPTLSFVMTTNLVLQANFIPSPFLSATGLYHGLLYARTAVLHESSGWVDLTVGEKGGVNGYLSLDGATNLFSGTFGLSGVASGVIPRQGKASLQFSLRVDLSQPADQITGTIATGAWGADLIADRFIYDAISNPTPRQGRYTLLFPGAGQDSDTPVGDGFVTFRIGPGGRVFFEGAMGDGRTFSQMSFLSKNSVWPLYVPLYEGRGSALTWITCDSGAGVADAEVSWVRPALQTQRYPNGFTNNVPLIGSRYAADPWGPLMLNYARVVYSGGGLSRALTDVFYFGGSKMAFSGLSRLAFNPTNGVFTGTFLHPEMRWMVTYQGAVVQKDNMGGGYFWGPTTSGRVRIEAAPLVDIPIAPAAVTWDLNKENDIREYRVSIYGPTNTTLLFAHPANRCSLHWLPPGRYQIVLAAVNTNGVLSLPTQPLFFIK